MNNLHEVKKLFKKAKLPFPPIPKEMESDIKCLSEWVYGTRTDTPSPYVREFFIDEIISKRIKDYVILGHAGHGMNSYAIHYYLVRGPLAIFIQWGWGGVYMDNGKKSEELRMLFGYVKELINTSEQAYYKKIVTHPKRLVIMESDFVGSFWGLSDSINDSRNQEPLSRGVSALKEASEWIEDSRKKIKTREETMTKYPDTFVHNLVEEIKKVPIPSNIKKESDLEPVIIKIVKNYTKKALGVGDSAINDIVFTHEEKKQWTESKKYQNIIVYGCSNTSDIFIKEPRLGTIYIELKFSKRRGDKESSALPGDLQRSIGQSIIASLVHTYVICLIVCETKIRKREKDHSKELHEKLRDNKIELIVRNMS